MLIDLQALLINRLCFYSDELIKVIFKESQLAYFIPYPYVFLIMIDKYSKK